MGNGDWDAENIGELDDRIEELESDRRFYVDACVFMAYWIMQLTRGRRSTTEIIQHVKESVPKMQKQQRVRAYFRRDK